MYCVYCHTNKINGKKYIGITGMKPERRWANGEGYKNSRYFYFAIKKNGWDAFEHKILFTGLSKEEACKKEKELINYYKTNDEQNGYNMSSGGESGAAGVHPTKETIEKRTRWTKGHKVSEETRRKMSEAAKGRVFSQETIEKMRAAKVGKKWSDETRKKMEKRPRHKMSDEAKKKLKEAKAEKMRPIYCEEKNMVYESVHEAARDLGLYATNISAVCRGKHKHTKGYHFSYCEQSKGEQK